MKNKLIALSVLLASMQASAQQTNELRPDLTMQTETNRAAASHHQRRVRFMHKALKDIGITDEQLAQVGDLQKKHSEKIKANMKRTNAARKKLSKLQRAGALREEISPVIDEISEAQKEGLWILVDNQMEMERILGKEKYAAFMEKARSKYRTHGRKGGMGMPPRPGLPPIPGDHKKRRQPPLPTEHGHPPPPAHSGE